jgi:hypothetical protein
MVSDGIMGLCGETGIEQGRHLVTMIQGEFFVFYSSHPLTFTLVFEYYISHHVTKAFEVSPVCLGDQEYVLPSGRLQKGLSQIPSVFSFLSGC